MNLDFLCFSLLGYIRVYQKKKARNHCGFWLFLKTQRFENWGARLAALRPYCFLPYGRKLLILLGFLGFHASVNPSVHPFRILFGVAPFFGANALFTTEDNSLGLLYFTLA